MCFIALHWGVYTFQHELCASDEELQLMFAIDEALSLLMETGFNKPICQLKLSDKTYIRAVLVDYHLMVKVKMQMDQFAEGLQELKVLDLIRAQPPLLKPLFLLISEAKMTAGELQCVQYSCDMCSSVVSRLEIIMLKIFASILFSNSITISIIPPKICCERNEQLRIENTRSAAAELGCTNTALQAALDSSTRQVAQCSRQRLRPLPCRWEALASTRQGQEEC